MSVEDAAASFGVIPMIVRQRLKLASVAPKLRAIYRTGRMTLSSDHEAEEAAWAAFCDWNRSTSAPTGDTVPLTDLLPCCVAKDPGAADASSQHFHW